MSLIRSAPFLRLYRFFPHAAINQVARRLARARHPRWLVQAVIRAWIRHDAIELGDFTIPRSSGFASLEELFLRRLRPEARPIDPSGIAAPVDGRLIAAGHFPAAAGRLAATAAPPAVLPVKGQRLSLDRVVNGRARCAPLGLEAYAGGSYAVIFLSPRGYHRIHMPVEGRLLDVRWLSGRFFPQNERALVHIPAVYERNERAVLRLQRAGSSAELLMVLVGASVVGGIELEGLSRRDWVGPSPFALGRDVARGAELGHFTFGSTVIVVAAAGTAGALRPAIGGEVRMGQRLWEVEHDATGQSNSNDTPD